MIDATCHTADNAYCVEFDATPWFSEAGAPSIVDWAQRGGLALRLRNPSRVDQDMNACTTSFQLQPAEDDQTLGRMS